MYLQLAKKLTLFLFDEKMIDHNMIMIDVMKLIVKVNIGEENFDFYQEIVSVIIFSNNTFE